MKYANTDMLNGIETVVTVLPLAIVPGFDPASPPQANTYGVDDVVQVGWIRENGVFVAPPPVVVPPPGVPEKIEALQGLKAIDAAGLSSAYESWTTAPARSFIQRAFIAKAQTWRRDDPILTEAAAALGLSDADVDALFVIAAAL